VPKSPSGADVASQRPSARAQARQFGGFRQKPGKSLLDRTAWWGWEDSNQVPSTQSCRTSLRHGRCCDQMSLDSSTVVRKNWQSQQIGAVVVVNSGSAEGAREILPRRRERRGGASVMSSLIRSRRGRRSFKERQQGDDCGERQTFVHLERGASLLLTWGSAALAPSMTTWKSLPTQSWVSRH
jgi:hypothetical protein